MQFPNDQKHTIYNNKRKCYENKRKNMLAKMGFNQQYDSKWYIKLNHLPYLDEI